MADPDYTLASKAYVPQVQPLNPLQMGKDLQEYRILKNKADQSDIDKQSLANYGTTRDARSLEGATPELRSTTLSGDSTEMAIKKDTMSRDAAYIANEKNPEIKNYLWKKKGEEYVKKGWVPQDIWDKHKDTPNDDVLENLQRQNTSVPQWRETTGETAGANAAATAPYQEREADPTKRYVYPAVGGGGPLENGSPVGHTLTAPGAAPQFSANGAPPPGAPTGTGPKPPGTVNLTDTNATVLPPGPQAANAPAQQPGRAVPGVPGTPSAAPGTNVTPVDKTNPYAAEVPSVSVGHDLPTGKGVVQPGVDPVRQAARVEGQKKYQELDEAAENAAHTRGSLGTMKAQLDRGATTDRLGDLKTTVAGLMYGVLGKDSAPEVKQLTGLDIGKQEVFNKESTRMGLTFARQTEGAREAVAAIKIALGANPSLLNSREGNYKIIGIMDQLGKYDQEKSKAAQAFMQKNDGHLQGFDTWWSQAHPPASFISKEVPYPTVVKGEHISKGDLQQGVTYTYGGPKGDDFKGTWDGEHFTKVQ